MFENAGTNQTYLKLNFTPHHPTETPQLYFIPNMSRRTSTRLSMLTTASETTPAISTAKRARANTVNDEKSASSAPISAAKKSKKTVGAHSIDFIS